jgi:hypothetical protein
MSARLLRRTTTCGFDQPAPGQLRPPRTVRRLKALWTSNCPSSAVSYVLPGRERGASYRYSGDCFCLSPERHAAQFADDDQAVHEA